MSELGFSELMNLQNVYNAKINEIKVAVNNSDNSKIL